LVKKIIEDLKENKPGEENTETNNKLDTLPIENISEKNKINFQTNTLKDEAKILAELVKEYFPLLGKEGLNILSIENLKKIQSNHDSDKNIFNEYEEIIKKISVEDKDKQFIQGLESIKNEVSDICKKIETFYNDHNDLILEYQKFQNLEKENLGEENICTLNRFSICNTNTLANISSVSTKKMSVISRNILFLIKDTKFKSPISAKDNEQIEKLIENAINNVSKLYSDNRADKSEKRIFERNPLISRLLYSLKLLSVSPINHFLIMELGLINFLEKLLNEKENQMNNIYIILETLDLVKNCTVSEASIPIFISSPIAETIINEINELYEKPQIISNDNIMKIKFQLTNKIFSNLCKNQKGFNFVFDKLGMARLIVLAKKTYNESILEAVLEMILNYLQNNQKEKIDLILNDIFNIIIKAFKVYEKNTETVDILTKALLVLGNICSEDTMQKITEINLIKIIIRYDLRTLLKNLPFFNALVFALGNILLQNSFISESIIESGLLKKIKENVNENLFDLRLLEKLTSMMANMLKNNIKIYKKFLEGDYTSILFLIIEKNILGDNNLHIQKGERKSVLNNLNNNICHKLHNENDELLMNSIILNIVLCFDSLTSNDEAIEYLTKTKFNQHILDIINKKISETEIVKIALHSLGNYFYIEIGSNIKNLNFENLLTTLQVIQAKQYSNSDILTNVNYVAGNLIRYLKETKDKENLFKIILVGIKAQDWNFRLVNNTLRLIYDIIDNFKFLQEMFFGEIFSSLMSIVNIFTFSGNNEVIYSTYNLILAFSKQYFLSLEMVNEGLLSFIKETFDYIQICSPKLKIHDDINELLFKIIEYLIIDINNKKKASDILTGKFILDLKQENPKYLSPSVIKIVSFFHNVFELKDKRNDFVQHNGVETLLQILKENITNIPLIKISFMLFSRLVANEDEYKKLLKGLKVIDLINEVSQTPEAKGDKEYCFISYALISDINYIKEMLQSFDDISVGNDIKVYNNPIKPDIRNFVTNGRLVRL